jgi:hypothetical protein
MEEGIPRKPYEVSDKFKESRQHVYDYTVYICLHAFCSFRRERQGVYIFNSFFSISWISRQGLR